MAKQFTGVWWTREGSDVFTKTAPKGAYVIRLYDTGAERVYVYRETR